MFGLGKRDCSEDFMSHGVRAEIDALITKLHDLFPCECGVHRRSGGRFTLFGYKQSNLLVALLRGKSFEVVNGPFNMARV